MLEGSSFTARNCLFICEGFDKTHFITAERDSTVFMSQCIFKDCSMFIDSHESREIRIKESVLLDCINHFLDQKTAKSDKKIYLSELQILFRNLPNYMTDLPDSPLFCLISSELKYITVKAFDTIKKDIFVLLAKKEEIDLSSVGEIDAMELKDLILAIAKAAGEEINFTMLNGTLNEIYLLATPFLFGDGFCFEFRNFYGEETVTVTHCKFVDIASCIKLNKNAKITSSLFEGCDKVVRAMENCIIEECRFLNCDGKIIESDYVTHASNVQIRYCEFINLKSHSNPTSHLIVLRDSESSRYNV